MQHAARILARRQHRIAQRILRHAAHEQIPRAAGMRGFGNSGGHSPVIDAIPPRHKARAVDDRQGSDTVVAWQELLRALERYRDQHALCPHDVEHLPKPCVSLVALLHGNRAGPIPGGKPQRLHRGIHRRAILAKRRSLALAQRCHQRFHAHFALLRVKAEHRLRHLRAAHRLLDAAPQFLLVADEHGSPSLDVRPLRSS